MILNTQIYKIKFIQFILFLLLNKICKSLKPDSTHTQDQITFLIETLQDQYIQIMIKRIGTQNLNKQYHNGFDYNIPKQNKVQMRHVTFESKKRNLEQQMIPTNKPSYHFTYGNNAISSYVSNQLIAPRKSHIQFVSDVKNGELPLSFDRILINKEVQRSNEKQNMTKQKSINRENHRSPSRNKKKLRIFPQNYKITSREDKYKENSQIAGLKNQIESLKKAIQFSKFQAQRTKRLSNLNTSNENLYNQLAWKLKQLSKVEYEMYLEQSNQQKILMQSILEHSSAKKSQSIYRDTMNRTKNHEDFIDIKQFQKEYQQKYNSRQISQSLQQSPVNHKNYLKNTQEVKLLKQSQEQVYSPFLLKQNKEDSNKSTFQFGASNPNFQQTIKQEKPTQSFTFHKDKHLQLRHFSKYANANTSKLILVENQEQKGYPKFVQPQKQKINPVSKDVHIKRHYTVERKDRRNRQIKDFNRQLEDMIMRKRVTSEYANLTFSKIRNM